MRIGQGFDAHRFGVGDHLMLGGVRIAFERGMVAHSDGDVVLHALSDALLGAAGLGDIGRHFPDSSDEFKGIDSRILLRRVMEQLHARRLKVINVDLTVVAQVPRLSPHIQAMEANIAADLRVSADRINVKATTTEQMGFTGRREGIACFAVALLQSAEQ